jgi:hypothetical protein
MLNDKHAESARQQDPLTQQVEFRSAKHLPLDQFETIDIPFNWAGAPVDRKSGAYSRPVAVEIATEAAEFRWAGGVRVRNPLAELAGASLADKDHEALCQSSTCGYLAAPPAQVGKQNSFCVVQLGAASQQQPA